MRLILKSLAAASVAVLCAGPALAADAKLEEIIAARSDDDKARDGARNPAATLDFFGLKPDMTVVESLPGGGWYTKIILPYIAEEGSYAGAFYKDDMWAKIIPGASEETLARFSGQAEKFPARAADFVEGEADVSAYYFGSAPDALKGEADLILFIRSLHNLNRLNADGGYLDEALAEAFDLLKPGGVAGVVQHRAPEDADDETSSGTRGYVKQSDMIAAFEGAGFELVETSEINANPKDQPGSDEIVWRLPPSLRFGDANRDEYIAIGESDRMTLKFRKPE